MADILNRSKTLVDGHAIAPKLGVSYARVINLAREDVIPCVRLGRQVRFDPDQIDAFIAAGGRAWAGGWRKTEGQ